MLWQHTCFRFRSFLAAPRLSYLHVGFIPIRLNIPWLCWADLGIGLLSCAVLLDMLAHHLDSCMRQIHSVRRPLLVCIRHAGDIEAGDRHAHLRLWIDRLIVLTRPVFHTSWVCLVTSLASAGEKWTSFNLGSFSTFASWQRVEDSPVTHKKKEKNDKPWPFWTFFWGGGELFIKRTGSCNERNHKRLMEGRPQLKLQATPKTWIETDKKVCEKATCQAKPA